MEHEHELHPGDSPVEMDCDCGTHHVIDPEVINRLMTSRKFRCYYCRRRLHTEALHTLVALGGDDIRGVCTKCARREGLDAD